MYGDQAYALRELVKRKSDGAAPARAGYLVVTGGSAEVGSTSVARAIAAVQADQELKTLLIDAAADAGASAVLGMSSQVALPEVIQDINQAPAAIGRGPGQAFFLPTHAVPAEVTTDQWQEIASSVSQVATQICGGFDTVIVDCGNVATSRWCPVWDHAAHVLVVTSDTDESIMGAYAAVKTHLPTQCRDIRILVNGAANRASAEQTWGRIAAAAKRFLGITLGFAGYLPHVTSGSAQDALHPALEHDATARLCLRRILSDLDVWQQRNAESAASECT